MNPITEKPVEIFFSNENESKVNSDANENSPSFPINSLPRNVLEQIAVSMSNEKDLLLFERIFTRAISYTQLAWQMLAKKPGLDFKWSLPPDEYYPERACYLMCKVLHDYSESKFRCFEIENDPIIPPSSKQVEKLFRQFEGIMKRYPYSLGAYLWKDLNSLTKLTCINSKIFETNHSNPPAAGDLLVKGLSYLTEHDVDGPDNPQKQNLRRLAVKSLSEAILQGVTCAPVLAINLSFCSSIPRKWYYIYYTLACSTIPKDYSGLIKFLKVNPFEVLELYNNGICYPPILLIVAHQERLGRENISIDEAISYQDSDLVKDSQNPYLAQEEAETKENSAIFISSSKGDGSTSCNSEEADSSKPSSLDEIAKIAENSGSNEHFSSFPLYSLPADVLSQIAVYLSNEKNLLLFERIFKKAISYTQLAWQMLAKKRGLDFKWSLPPNEHYQDRACYLMSKVLYDYSESKFRCFEIENNRIIPPSYQRVKELFDQFEGIMNRYPYSLGAYLWKDLNSLTKLTGINSAIFETNHSNSSAPGDLLVKGLSYITKHGTHGVNRLQQQNLRCLAFKSLNQAILQGATCAPVLAINLGYYSNIPEGRLVGYYDNPLEMLYSNFAFSTIPKDYSQQLPLKAGVA